MAQQRESSDDQPKNDRRALLKGVGAVGVVTSVGSLGLASAGASLDRQDTTTETTTTAEPTTGTPLPDDVTPILLGGEVEHWFGLMPEAIHGKENPVLSLEAGQTYRLVWMNLDGEPHEPVIEDADGNVLVSTAPARVPGATRAVTFEATPEMAEYYCTFHPQMMRAAVEVDGETEIDIDIG